MSAGGINTICELWAASLAPHAANPPLSGHTDLYNTIDRSPLGDVPWESFFLRSTAGRDHSQDDELPSWMSSEYMVWFRDPQKLVQNLLSNPDFRDEIDYSPFHEYVGDQHRFQDFMSGDWAWKQAVCTKPPSVNC